MRRGEVFFHPMEGSGQLSISWSPALKGAAVEATKGNGVGFFSADGDLLSVIFDDVFADDDHQILQFKKYKIEVSVKNGIVSYKLIQSVRPQKARVSKKTSRVTLRRRKSKIKR